jgi:hypothetical protein
MGNFSFDPVAATMARQVMEEQFKASDQPEPDMTHDLKDFKTVKGQNRKASRSWLNQVLGWFYGRNYEQEMK